MIRIVVLLYVLFTLPAAAFPVARCINLSNFLEAPAGEIWGPPITDAHLDRIAEAGFDTVRIPVRFSEGWNGRIEPGRISESDRLVRAALARGLNAIVVVHHYDELMRDPQTHGPRLRAIWAELAEIWEDMPEGLIFELLNEPAPPLDTAGAVALFDEIVPMIRATHPTRWIIIEGGRYAHRDALAGLPAYDARTVPSFHYYDPYRVTHQLAPWEFPVLPPLAWAEARGTEIIARHMAAARAAVDGPLFLGEFGVYRLAPLPLRAGWTRAVREAAEAQGMAWCVWGFAAEFRIFDTDTDQWIGPLREALLGE